MYVLCHPSLTAWTCISYNPSKLTFSSCSYKLPSYQLCSASRRLTRPLDPCSVCETMTALNDGLKAMVLFLLLFTRVVSSQEQTCEELQQWKQCFKCSPACLDCYLYEGFFFNLCNKPAVKKNCESYPFIPGCELCETQYEICTQPGCVSGLTDERAATSGQ
jgi:hypothetical protein